MKLSDLKVGHRVVVEGKFNQTLTRVTKVTPTQIHVGASKYRKSDGKRIGEADRWAFSTLRPATPIDMDSARRVQLIKKLQAITIESMEPISTGDLGAACALLGLTQ